MQLQTNNNEVKQQILQVLNWNEEQYFWYQYEAGIQYLQLYLPGDVEGQAILKKQTMFWNWWKNHWYARELAFLMNAEFMPYNLCIELYYYLHDASELVKEIKLSKVIVGNSFATQI